MDYLTRVIWPYALLGAVASGVVYVYGHQFGSFTASTWVTGAINKLITTLGLKTDSGVGEFISTVLNIFIMGALIGVSVYITNTFVPIPSPGAITSPVRSVVAGVGDAFD